VPIDKAHNKAVRSEILRIKNSAELSFEFAHNFTTAEIISAIKSPKYDRAASTDEIFPGF